MGSGSAAAEHLTNPAKGKRPREMPTESNKALRQWIYSPGVPVYRTLDQSSSGVY